jgi:hypothetical protein
MRFFLLIVMGCLALGLCAPSVAAQQTDAPPPLPVPADTTEQDSLRQQPPADTTQAVPINPQPADSLRQPSGGGQSAPPASAPPQAGSAQGNDNLNEAVQLSARDSLIITFDEDDGDVGSLYGEASMQYQQASLEGPQIDMYFERNELRASQPNAGASRPVFQQGEGDAFTGSTLSYNLGTGRGRVVGARRPINEGFVEGSVTKVYEDSTVFLQNGIYSTCDCPRGETPSYSLRSNQMKLADKWVYSGPIQLFIFNIPTPFVLPFGFLPNVQGRRSGPLPPQYGEDERGLYLNNWGWYFAMNDYMDLQLRFGIWSQGSYQIQPTFRYEKRYNYGGTLDLDYSYNRRGERGDPDFTQNRQGALRWSHQQTINPTTDFNSNLRLVTSSNYLRTNSDDYRDNVRQSISSSMRFSKRWPDGGRRLNLSLNHNQNFADNSVNLTLPSLSFSQNSFKPFQSEDGTRRDQAWYERLTFDTYNFDVDNRYNFRPLNDSLASAIPWYEALLSPSKYRRATGNDEPFDFQATHRTGLSLPFSLQRYQLNLSPSISYDSEWYIRTVRQRLVPGTDSTDAEVVEETVPGFFARREFSSGISANTTFYGLFPVGVGQFQGVRHTVRPSLSFNYQPNFNTGFWGYTRTFENENGELERYDIINGRTVRGTSEQRAMSFRIGNVFETKRVRTDSTGETQSESLRLLNLDVSSSYNFAADSLNLSDIRLSARTDILEQFDVAFRSTFSPYALGPNGRTINRYVAEGPGLAIARLTNLNLSLGTAISGGSSARGGTASRSGGMSPGGPPSQRPGTTGRTGRTGRQGAQDNVPQLDPYANFSIPWSLDLDFSYGLRRTGTRTSRRANLNTSFRLRLTPKWQVTGITGYDFIDRELVRTDISINRDLGCWVMAFNWVPFGRAQSYGFSLRVKSGPVQDLLNLRLPRSDRGGFFDRVGQQAGSLAGGGGFR